MNLDRSLVTWARSVYVLQGLGVVLAAWSVVSRLFELYFIGIPGELGLVAPVIALVLNYSMRGNAKGSFLETHFRWQIGTFWWGFGLTVLSYTVFAIWFALGMSGIGWGTPLMGDILRSVVTLSPFCVIAWVAYRVVRGWLALRNGRPIPLA